MHINHANLRALFVAFNAAFKEGLGMAESQYGRIATTVPSTTGSEEYGWLGNFPNMREWLGDRVVHAVRDHGYTVKNRDFELTVAVPRNAIEDDNYGVYTPMVQELGRSAAAHPDQLMFDLLKAGGVNNCYDGTPFFSATHPVINDKGKAVTQTNVDGSATSGTVWYLLDTSRVLKPLIYQDRKKPNFVALTAENDDNVFNRKEFVYGVDARRNGGYGFWQLAFASNKTLNAENFEAALVAMTSRKGDHGRPLGIRPNLLVVPATLESAAKRLLSAELVNDGNDVQVSNPHVNAAELLVSPWL